MGRGRAKAKQTKVARELKYNTGNPDLDALQAELSATGVLPAGDDDAFDDPDSPEDPYAKYYEDDEGTDEDDSEEPEPRG